MERSKIIPIIVTILVAIVVIAVIVFAGNLNNKDDAKLEYYVGTINKGFENKLIKDYSALRKFTREVSLETTRKNHQNYNVLETFNEEYFQNNKLAVISIPEDNSSDYLYEVTKVTYDENKTTATIEYRVSVTGYNGTLTSSWVNCVMVELEGTVTNVEFVEVSE